MQRDEYVGFVSDNDIDLLSNNIRTFDLEVQTAARAERAKENSGSKQPLTDFYLREVFPLVRDWNQWVTDNTGTLSRLFGDAAYAAYRARYMAVRERWIKELSQSTSSNPVGSKDADVSDDIKHAATSGISTALLIAMGFGVGYILLNRRNRDAN